MTGASRARSVRFLAAIETPQRLFLNLNKLTITFRASSVDTGTPHEYIVYNCEDTLATHPSPIFVLDLTIIQCSGLVHFDTSAMYSSGKWDLVRMEIVPT